MQGRIRGVGAVVAACVVAVTVAACGSSSGSGSSGSAQTLLRQTFSGSHTVNSGDLSFSITLNPSGSTKLTTPITLSFGGPFQSLGKGKLPKSNFNVSISALGHTGTLGILSTGTAGYVTLQGTSYQLPQATFQKLESSFASVGGGGRGLGTLGVDPLQWLVHPTVAGTQTVAGTATTHVHAGVNVPVFLRGLSTLVVRAGATGGISAATQGKIAGEVRNPVFDVWTGNSDKTVRKLSIDLTLPVTGALSTELGGLNSAGLNITMQYGDLNQPQNIVAPTSTAPYTQFQSKISSIVQAIESAVGVQLPTSSGSSSSSSSGSSSSASSSADSAYTQCITQAGGDVSKMQKCSSKLGQ